jgi:hypothetical protein
LVLTFTGTVPQTDGGGEAGVRGEVGPKGEIGERIDGRLIAGGGVSGGATGTRFEVLTVRTGEVGTWMMTGKRSSISFRISIRWYASSGCEPVARRHKFASSISSRLASRRRISDDRAKSSTVWVWPSEARVERSAVAGVEWIGLWKADEKTKAETLGRIALSLVASEST